ncbi:uncharacterized protein LOC135216517 [Macrobrachium nipponense]|uniref:uncharacterized protein LOC135216517 n=1 Tax=Macrobrachium nipponense TaxID=159736 RepID=UPI0030C86C2F
MVDAAVERRRAENSDRLVQQAVAKTSGLSCSNAARPQSQANSSSAPKTSAPSKGARGKTQPSSFTSRGEQQPFFSSRKGDTHLLVLQEVTTLYPQWDGVPIQGPLLRTLDCPLGVHASVHTGVSLIDSRISRFRQATQRFLLRQEQPAQLWQVVIGHLSSLEKLIPHGCIHLRSLQWRLKECWSQAQDLQSFLVPLMEEVREDLAWWLDDRNLLIGVELRTPPPEMLLFSDASNEGWGAHLKKLLVSGVWDRHNEHFHINFLEIKAAYLALQEFQTQERGHSVVLMSDNTMVVAYVNKQGGLMSLSLHQLTVQVHEWAEADSMKLSARYIPGKKNVVADKLSCQNQVIGTKWSLHPDVVKRLFDLWGHPVVDLFATQHNRKLPVFFVVLDPWAAAEDAFQHPWDNLEVYTFPLFRLIRKVISTALVTSNLRMILVAPKWPQAI